MNSERTPVNGKPNMFFKRAILLSIEIIGILLCITGIVLLCLHTKTIGNETVVDYTDCKDLNQPTTRCKDKLETTMKPCSCYIDVNITKPMDAPVTMFYELDSYNQNEYSHSRNDDQLLGKLSVNDLDSCGAFSYADTPEGRKPIAPCGALADAMFNDTFNLQINNTYVPYILTGVVPEDNKKHYRNPPGNLEEGFKPFTKPTNWTKNVWELDTQNPDNNGFQNEAFIAWMSTDLKRKPAWRINHTGPYERGVPAGTYTLRVIYAYPAKRYDGRRLFIISSIRVELNPYTLGFGIALLVLGLIVIIGKILYNKKKSGNFIQRETMPLYK